MRSGREAVFRADPRRIGIFCGAGCSLRRRGTYLFIVRPRHSGPIGCFQFSVGAPEEKRRLFSPRLPRVEARHTGEMLSLVRTRRAERTEEEGRRERYETGTKRKREERRNARARARARRRGEARGGGGKRRRRRWRKEGRGGRWWRASASNADIRHTTSNAGAARWRLDRPTDSKDSGRSAMKSSLRRNCKKMGKN